jgi:hypothetical protein
MHSTTDVGTRGTGNVHHGDPREASTSRPQDHWSTRRWSVLRFEVCSRPRFVNSGDHPSRSNSLMSTNYWSDSNGTNPNMVNYPPVPSMTDHSVSKSRNKSQTSVTFNSKIKNNYLIIRLTGELDGTAIGADEQYRGRRMKKTWKSIRSNMARRESNSPCVIRVC